MNFLDWFRSLFVGYDTFERHRLVAEQVNDSSVKILDVGGDKNRLAFFSKNPITVLNLNHGDVIGSGLSLPFQKNTFDIIVSLDVMEHIPKSGRQEFIEELLRVARTGIIFCAPYGSPAHETVERDLLATLEKDHIHDRMLAEHVQFGLPTVEEIAHYLPVDSKSNYVFSGDLRFNLLLFQIDHWMGKRFKLVKAAVLFLFNMFGNLVIFPLTLKTSPSRYTNRFLVMVRK
jgi:SAM-dependent methyltransferase